MDSVIVKAKLKLGGYGSLQLAKADSLFFRHPRVFEDRSIIFPKPRDYQVTPRTITVAAGEWTNPSNPLNTHYVEVTMAVKGPQANVDRWLLDVLARANRYTGKAELERIEDDAAETPSA